MGDSCCGGGSSTVGDAIADAEEAAMRRQLDCRR